MTKLSRSCCFFDRGRTRQHNSSTATLNNEPSWSLAILGNITSVQGNSAEVNPEEAQQERLRFPSNILSNGSISSTDTEETRERSIDASSMGYLEPNDWVSSPIGTRIKPHSSIEHLRSRKPSQTRQRQWHEPFDLNYNIYNLPYYDGFQKEIKARGEWQKELDWKTHWVDLQMELDIVKMYHNTIPPRDDSETKWEEGFYDGLFQALSKDIREIKKDFGINDRAHHKTVRERDALGDEFFVYQRKLRAGEQARRVTFEGA